MSSYLTIYAKVKGVEKPVALDSYSRNSDVYQYCYEEGVCYIYKNGIDMINSDGKDVEPEYDYTELDEAFFNNVIEDIDKSIESANKRISHYREFAGQNEEYIHHIIEDEEYVSDLQYTRGILVTYQNMARAAKDGFTGVEKLLANID